MADEDGKKHCGSFVVMKSGKRYLFSVENSRVVCEPLEMARATATATSIWPQFVRGYEDGKEVFCAPLENVECWGGDTWFFKDAWWGKQPHCDSAGG